MKINTDEYKDGDRVVINAELDDGDGWYWKLKKKKATIYFDEYGFHVKTDEGDRVAKLDITAIKRLSEPAT